MTATIHRLPAPFKPHPVQERRKCEMPGCTNEGTAMLPEGWRLCERCFWFAEENLGGTP